MSDIVELVSFPPHDGIVKMVQLLLGEKRDRRIIVFGNTYLASDSEGLSETHSMILMDYLDAQGIHWEPKDPAFRFSDPESRGKEYFLSGAGKAQISYDEKKISLYSHSIGYRLKPDSRNYEGLSTDFLGWSLFVR